jgi:transcriptional regulator with XRE-family HTH domain
MKAKKQTQSRQQETVTNNIKAIRESRGMTQEALAAKLGTSTAQVNRLEKSVRKLTVEWLLRICGALDATADEIVDLPVSKKFGGKKADDALMGTILGAIFETAENLDVDVSRQELVDWSNYVYREVLDGHMNHRETVNLASHVVKFNKRRAK